jgi:two-component system cell cycle response regulator DivK
MPQVLYIEDNSDNRMLVRRILMASDYDFALVEADNAQKGIELALAQLPDLILMDLSMPQMDGLTATRLIRNLPALNDIPVVALTANAMESDRERSLEAGCDGYIRKPIDVDKFADEVFQFIRSRHERRSKQQPADADLD